MMALDVPWHAAGSEHVEGRFSQLNAFAKGLVSIVGTKYPCPLSPTASAIIINPRNFLSSDVERRKTKGGNHEIRLLNQRFIPFTCPLSRGSATRLNGELSFSFALLGWW